MAKKASVVALVLFALIAVLATDDIRSGPRAPWPRRFGHGNTEQKRTALMQIRTLQIRGGISHRHVRSK